LIDKSSPQANIVSEFEISLRAMVKLPIS